jgi:hypothetical protein
MQRMTPSSALTIARGKKQSSFTRPTAPNPIWPRKPDDGLIVRGAKRFVSNQWHDHAISLRRWQFEAAEKRQEKAARQQAEQARPHPQAGSGSGSSSDPFIMGDDSKPQGWSLFGQGSAAPEPAPQRSRGPRR